MRRFLWAKLQLETLCKKKTEKDILDALGLGLKAGLDEIYRSKLLEILDLDETAQRVVEVVFASLLYAKEPLHPLTLLEILRYEDVGDFPSEFDFITVCCNLIIWDSSTAVFRFCHTSAQEFLRQQSHFSPVRGHDLLARVCLRCCSLGPPDAARPSIPPPTKDFYHYAALYWPEHVRELDLHHSQDCRLDDELFEFVFGESHVISSAAFALWLDWTRELVEDLPPYHTLAYVLEPLQSHDMSPLFPACTLGLAQLLQYLLENHVHVDLERTSNSGHTPLYLACSSGHVEVVFLLLRHGADTGVQCGSFGGPLHVACFKGHLSTVKTLLVHGASDFRTTAFETSFEAACSGGSESVARYLIDNGSLIHDETSYTDIMQQTIQAGFANLSAWLVLPTVAAKLIGKEQGLVDQNGVMLTAAIRRGNVQVLRGLLRNRPQLRPMIPADCIAMAANAGHENMVSFLHEEGFDPSVEGPLGSPLLCICASGDERVLRKLLNLGVTAQMSKTSGETLQVAAQNGHMNIIKALLEEGFDINAPTKPFGNCLQAACFRGHKGAVKLLLDNHADMYQKGHYGDALHAATAAGHVDVASYLLERGYVAGSPLPATARGDHQIPQQTARGRRQRNRQVVDDASDITEVVRNSRTVDSSSDESSESDESVEAVPKIPRTRKMPTNQLYLAAYLGNLPILRQTLLKREEGLGYELDVNGCIKAAASSGQVKALKLLFLEVLKHVSSDRFDVTSILSLTIESGRFEAFIFVLGWCHENGNGKVLHWGHMLNTAARERRATFVASILQSIPESLHLDAVIAALPIALQHEESRIATLLWDSLRQRPLSLVDSERPFTIQRVLFLQPYVNTSSDGGRKRAELQLKELLLVALEQSDQGLRHELIELVIRAHFDVEFTSVLLMQICQRGLVTFMETLMHLQPCLAIQPTQIHRLLSIAISFGHIDIVQGLIEEVLGEVFYDELTLYLSDSVILATARGHHKVIKYLFRSEKIRGLILRSGSESLLSSLLAVAAETGHIRLVRLYLEEGADINSHVPSIYPMRIPEEHARILLGSKMEPSADFAQREASHYHNSLSSVVFIPVEGSTQGPFECTTSTPLQVALRGYNRLRKQVNPRSRALYYHLQGTAKDEARHNLILSELLQQGADPDDHGTDRRTPLQLAVIYAGDVAVQILLDNNASAVNTDENESLVALAAARDDEVAFPVIARLVAARYSVSSRDAQTFVHNVVRSLDSYVSPWGRYGRSALFCRGASREPEQLLSLILAKKIMDGGILSVLRKLFEYMPDIDISFKLKPALMILADAEAENFGSTFVQVLKVAAVAGNLATVQLLIKHGVSVNVSLNDETALDAAARLNHISTLKALLKAGAKPSIEGAIDGRSRIALRSIFDNCDVADMNDCALKRAVQTGDVGIVQMILKQCRDSTEISQALFHACDIGKIAMVDVLLQAGALVDHLSEHDAYSELKLSPLFIAVKRGHKRVVQMLLENGADPNIKSDDDLAFPLIAATHEGCFEMVQLLLQYGANANCKAPERMNTKKRWVTSITQSWTGHNNKSVTSYDLDRTYLDDNEFEWEDESDVSVDEDDLQTSQQDFFRARLLDTIGILCLSSTSQNLRMTDVVSSTPLQLACENGFSAIARELIAQGVPIRADPETLNLFFGCFDGAWSSSKREILQMLCDHALEMPEWDAIGHASFARAAIKGTTEGFEFLAGYFPPSEVLLSFACICSSRSTVETCVNHGIGRDTLLFHGLAPLHLACLFLQDELVLALLKDGADPDFPSALGQTPLTCTILGFQNLLQTWNGYPDHQNTLHIIPFERIVQTLLDGGANVDGGSSTEAKALHLACFLGHVPVARMLIEKSQEIDQWTVHYGTPLFAALDGDCPPVVEILLEHGANADQVRTLPSNDTRCCFKHLHRDVEDSHMGSVTQAAIEAAFGKESPWLLQTFLPLAPGIDVSNVLTTAVNASFDEKTSWPNPPKHRTRRSPSEVSDLEILLEARSDLHVPETVIERLLNLDRVPLELLSYAQSRCESSLSSQLIERVTTRLQHLHAPPPHTFRRAHDGGQAKLGDAFPQGDSSGLHEAVPSGDNSSAQQTLLDVVKHLEAGSSDIDQTLIEASGKDRESVVRALLEKGASGSRSINGQNALSAASYSGSVSVLNLLLSGPGIHAELTDHYNRTPLWWAAAGGNVQTIRMLLNQYQSNPCRADSLGRSPALIAAKNGHHSAMELLLGSVTNMTTGEYETTLAAFTTRWPSRFLFCDVCQVPIRTSQHHYHCDSCSGGDWDMCKECKEAGASCFSTKHVLIQRAIRDGAWVEVLHS